MNSGNARGSTLNDKSRHFAHRPLNEDVLHSAQEDVLGEVEWNERQSPEKGGTWLAPLGKRVSQFVANEPLKASLLAMTLGAVLTLVLQHGPSRGKPRT